MTYQFNQTVANTVANIDIATETGGRFDFSRWFGGNRNHDVITDLGLTGEETALLLNQQYGLSERLAAEFKFLSTNNGKPKMLLRMSIVFEHYHREVSYEDLAAELGSSCNTCYQQGLKLREAYQQAFGLTLQHDGNRLMLIRPEHVQLLNERAIRTLEKELVPVCQKLASQLRSLQQSNQQYSLSGRTQALLQAALMSDTDS